MEGGAGGREFVCVGRDTCERDGGRELPGGTRGICEGVCMTPCVERESRGGEGVGGWLARGREGLGGRTVWEGSVEDDLFPGCVVGGL